MSLLHSARALARPTLSDPHGPTHAKSSTLTHLFCALLLVIATPPTSNEILAKLPESMLPAPLFAPTNPHELLRAATSSSSYRHHTSTMKPAGALHHTTALTCTIWPASAICNQMAPASFPQHLRSTSISTRQTTVKRSRRGQCEQCSLSAREQHSASHTAHKAAMRADPPWPIAARSQQPALAAFPAHAPTPHAACTSWQRGAAWRAILGHAPPPRPAAPPLPRRPAWGHVLRVVACHPEYTPKSVTLPPGILPHAIHTAPHSHLDRDPAHAQHTSPAHHHAIPLKPRQPTSTPPFTPIPHLFTPPCSHLPKKKFPPPTTWRHNAPGSLRTRSLARLPQPAPATFPHARTRTDPH